MFIEPITPTPELHDRIEENASAATHLCWTCSSCDSECPIHRASDRLRPQKIVRMANLGMLDTLLNLKELWYCLSCRRCQQVCPLLVKPYEVIRYLRQKAMEQGIYAEKLIPHYFKLVAEFQRVRWRAAAACFKSDLEYISDQQWHRWLKTPMTPPMKPTYYRRIKLNPKNTLYPIPSPSSHINSNKCFTCSECSGCCPVFCEQNVFDPQRIIRMVNLGLAEKLLKSPSIWLCLQCNNCSDACSQKVHGHKIILRLQELAIEKGVVDPFFRNRLLKADKIIYPRFLDAIDMLLGLYSEKTLQSARL